MWLIVLILVIFAAIYFFFAAFSGDDFDTDEMSAMDIIDEE